MIGWIYLLPSETSKVIFKYYPKWMISCFLPSSLRKIEAVKVDYETDVLLNRTFTINVPDLLLSHTLRKPWIDHTKLETYFSLYALDPNSPDICILPYQLSNVYPSARICFGEVALDAAPTNLRQANNYYWASPFNDDNCPFLDQHYRNCQTRDHDHFDEERIRELEAASRKLAVESSIKGLIDQNTIENLSARCSCCLNECACTCFCDLNEVFFDWIKNYEDKLKNQKYTKSNNLFCGERYYAHPLPITALFMTNNAELIKQIPETLHRKDAQGVFILGPAKQIGDTWEVEFSTDHKVRLDCKDIEVI